MSLSAFLEVAIGLVFTYLLLSLIATWVNEWLASLLGLRGNDLKEAIGELLDDPGKIDAFYEHPLIKALGKKKENGELKRLPSYIPDRIFAVAALETLSEKRALVVKTKGQLEGLIETMPATVKETFETFMRSGSDNVELLLKDIETWFNDKMDRLSGYYKRRAQWVSLAVGFILALGLNIDTIVIADALYRDQAVRSGVAAYIDAHADDFKPVQGEDATPVDKLQEAMLALELPMGWEAEQIPQAPQDWLAKVVGWLLTALAVSQGAPFWFDLLQKLVSLRSSGVVPEIEKETERLRLVLEDKVECVETDVEVLKKQVFGTK